MAASQRSDTNASCSEEQIQSMVRSIFGELIAAEQSANQGASGSNDAGGHASVAGEIGHRFRLPRNAVFESTCASSSMTDQSQGAGSNNTNQDVSPSLNVAQTLSAVVPSFNPQLNYANYQSRCGPVRPRRSVEDRRRSTVYRRNDRGSRSATSQSSSQERNEIFMKDICLLPQSCAKIPRREVKTKLQNEGCYVDAFMLDKRWDESTLRLKILGLFSKHLDSDRSFDFVKSSGTSVVPINLPGNQSIGGKVLKHIAGNGPVYIRSRCPNSLENEDGYSTSDDDQMCSTFTAPEDIRNYTNTSHSSQQVLSPAAKSPSADSLPICNTSLLLHSSKEDTSMPTTTSEAHGGIVAYTCTPSQCEEVIQEMFPSLPPERIQQALTECNMSVELAISRILRDSESATHDSNTTDNPDGDGDDSDVELLDTPLSKMLIPDDTDGFRKLQEFVDAVVDKFGVELEIEVDRNTDLLKQVLRKYKNPAFDITKPLSVSFLHEPGMDAGGLTREYFHLLMQRVQKQCGTFDLLEGRNGNLLPIHNYDVLSGGLFILLGKMILHSTLNNCLGLPGLSPAIIAYLTSGCRDAAVEKLTIKDLPDPVYQNKLQELLVCGEEKLGEFTTPDSSLDISDLLMSAGYPHITVTAERRRLAFECCLIHEVITKRLPALNDIRKGLDSVKVLGKSCLDMLAEWPEIRSRFFPAPAPDVIDLATLRKSLLYETDDNCDGQQTRQAQEYFEKYLEELSARDAGEKLPDLIFFWTAQPSLPLDNLMLKVNFLPPIQNKALPEANTCPMILIIPTIHPTYDAFSRAMDTALSCEKKGFGKL